MKKKCKICKDMAVLMKIDLLPPYYYHYSVSYSKGCSQRMNIEDERLVEWTKEDEIKHLIKLLRSERKIKLKCLNIMTPEQRRKLWR